MKQGDSESLDGCGVDSQPANPINSTGFFHEVARRHWSPGIWVNGLALGAIIAATVIWLWPSERVAEDKPLLPASLGQREQGGRITGYEPPHLRRGIGSSSGPARSAGARCHGVWGACC